MYQRPRGLSFFPPFIKLLMFANVGIFILQVFADGFTFGGVPLGDAITKWFALWPLGENFWPWQFFSYQYLHGSFGHLFFNMFALWMFGMELENIWGSKRFAAYYTLSGIAAGLLHMAVTPLMGGMAAPTIGASGSIMGVLLAFGLLFPDRPVMMFPIFFPIPARFFVLIYAAIDLFLGITNAGDGVAHFAHLGGALGGFLLLKFGDPIWNWLERRKGSRLQSDYGYGPIQDVEYRDVDDEPSFFQQPRSSAASEESTVVRSEPGRPETYTRFVVDGQRISQEQIDAILDKISQAGYHSLTEHEKNILFQVSRQL